MRSRLVSFQNNVIKKYTPNPLGYAYYSHFLWKKYVDRSFRTADPFTLIEVDPACVDNRDKNGYDKWKNMGEVRDGDWQTKPLIDHIKYRSIFRRFNSDIPWEDTELYQRALTKIDNKEAYWNACRTIDDINVRTKEVEDLYDRIRTEGFKSQEEIHEKTVREILLSPLFDRSKTDISVSIDQHGNILFIDGTHRLAIANALELEVVPVRVVVRHERWQEIRNELRRASSLSELSDRSQTHIDHPDVRSVLSERIQDDIQ